MYPRPSRSQQTKKSLIPLTDVCSVRGPGWCGVFGEPVSHLLSQMERSLDQSGRINAAHPRDAHKSKKEVTIWN